jgi:DinB superfamily
MNTVLNQLQREIACSLHGLNAELTQLRPPTPSKWSTQQIIEHLLLTYTGAETALIARLTKGRPTLAKPTAYQRIQQFAVCNCGYFPQGRSAPEMVTPAPTTHQLSGAELIAATEDHLSRLDLLCNECEQLFGKTRFAAHNVLGPLNVNQWRRFQLIHGRHHLNQIAAIRKAHNLEPSRP